MNLTVNEPSAGEVAPSIQPALPVTRVIARIEAEHSADLAACAAQVDEAMHQLRVANDRARPGLLRRAVAAVPWIAGGYVTGRLLR